MLYKNRAFISYDGKCPFACKHCYTFSLPDSKSRDVNEILEGIKNESFDIIYVSQKNENFSNPDAGIQLCERAFERYGTDIIIITRNILNDIQLQKLALLSSKMKEKDKRIIVAVSFISLNNYEISEDPKVIPNPISRINFLKRVHDEHIPSIALIRPIFPKQLIPLNDLFLLIDKCKPYVNCVVASELGVNKDIEKRLGIDFSKICSFKRGDYLKGAINENLSFLQLDEEVNSIANKCKEENIRFFTHSMQAINYICGEEKNNG